MLVVFFVLAISTIVLLTLITNRSEKSASPVVDELINENKVIKVIPGNSYVLGDGESTIQFGSSGSATAVPNIVFGADYKLNDIHAINSLPIRKEIIFHNNGRLFTLKNLECETEERFTDVKEIWVSSCSIEVNTEVIDIPAKKMASFNEQITVNTPFNGALSSNEDNVFVYVKAPNLSLQKWGMGELKNKVGLEKDRMTSYSTTTPYDITLITGLGIETIRYSSDEVWNKETKSVKIGLLEIISVVKDYSCEVVYTNDLGEQTQQCDNIIFELSAVGKDGSNYPVKIINYSE